MTGLGGGSMKRRRGILGALLALAFVGALLAIPSYRVRMLLGANQVLGLPRRLRMSEFEAHANVKREEYIVVDAIRERTFPDAVILIPDGPSDGNLASVLWTAYYLYPRVIVQRKTADADPEVHVDFVLVTPNFPPDIPPEARGDRPNLMPVSERAKRHVRGGVGR